MRVNVLSILMLPCGALLLLSGCSGGNSAPTANPKVVEEIRNAGGASGAGKAAVAQGEGWGGLKGVFTFDGTPPVLPRLVTGGKDGAVCDAHPIPDERLVVDSATKGIRDIVIYANRVSRVHDDFKDPPQEPAIFDQKECVFLSHVLAVRLKQPIHLKNSDPVGHNTNISAIANPSFNSSIEGGKFATYTFEKPESGGPVPVACNIHTWMKAFIVPRKDPYIAVSKADGSFEIEKLPAGEEIEFRIWHELQKGGLEARPEWKQGRFKLKIPKDEVHDLKTIAVPAAVLPVPPL